MSAPATTNPAPMSLTRAAVAAGLALNLTLLALMALGGQRLNSDFMAFWSFPRFVAGHDPRLIYDAPALMAFQRRLYPGFGSFYPYLYPPTLLVVTAWLKALGFGPALLVWNALGLAALGLAVRAQFGRRWGAVMALLLGGPAALITASTGETAFFTTALMLTGYGWLGKRPWAAGVAFGLLTLKPQLGVMVPFVLLARFEWRTALAATLVASVLVALSCLAYPPDLWALWWHTLPRYQGQYFNATSLNLNIIVTPAANLVVLGAGQRLAWVVQVLVAFVLVALVWWAARKGRVELAGALAIAATFIAQPHAYAYDGVVLGVALVWWLARAGLSPGRLALAGLVYFGPWLLLSPWHHWFLFSPVIGALVVALAGQIAENDG
ncbi:glycosyltransferase family 87 protein [Acidocella sp.]|uniref:glycosyltransferase family 87 protein n=1 Tax=Acidocella sp. TaxID=50710 RepID=UPI00262257D3|nr:glycosyltransferase family 87 protein [Acidocella sp.]